MSPYDHKVKEEDLEDIILSEYHTVLATSKNNSKFTVKELPLETFYLQEFSAPDGYMVDSQSVIVKYLDYKDSGTSANGREVYTVTVSHADKANITSGME